MSDTELHFVPSRVEGLPEVTAVLTTAMKGVDEPEVVKELEQKIKAHDENLAERLDAARQLAGRLNKPAADWEAKDLDGKAWSLAGLRGKVVVMDFWYRGCGWCMYAMPRAGRQTHRRAVAEEARVKTEGRLSGRTPTEGVPLR